MNWPNCAFPAIGESAQQATVNSAERNLTAAMAVRRSALCGKTLVRTDRADVAPGLGNSFPLPGSVARDWRWNLTVIDSVQRTAQDSPIDQGRSSARQTNAKSGVPSHAR